MKFCAKSIGMWPFKKRGCREGTPCPRPEDLPRPEEFAVSDASLKVWLTQPLVDRINWLSVKLDASRPDVMRGLIFDHLYGRMAYVELMSLQSADSAGVLASPMVRPPHSASIDQVLHRGVSATRGSHDLDFGMAQILTSRDRQTSVDLEYLGKSDEDLTITMPSRMKADLETVAARHRLTPSSYVRKLLVLELMGECKHGAWQAAVGNISRDVLEIEKS